VLELFDATPLDLVAPVRVATNFYGGQYLVYSHNKSAKFRIDRVWADKAVLSGMYFDPAPASMPMKSVVVTDFSKR
jgi:hypothetical protein